MITKYIWERYIREWEYMEVFEGVLVSIFTIPLDIITIPLQIIAWIIFKILNKK